MKPEHTKNYSKFAQIYSHYMRKINYNVWSEYLSDFLLEYLSEDSTVLELAAGEGNLSLFLSKYFKHYYISDLSIEMLKNCDWSNQKICCDMRALPFKKKFDLVLMVFDSINYLLTKKDLLKVANQVSSVLNTGGIFTFDASLEANSYEHIHPFTEEKKFKKIKYRHKSWYNEKQRIHYNEFQIIDSKNDISLELHRQKIYKLEDYFEVFEKTDLYVIGCYDAFSYKEPKAKSLRAQFILRKG